MSFKLKLKTVSLLLLISITSLASEMYWPNSKYAASIPSHQEVLGYEVGEKITNHSQMLNYFNALVKAAPEQIKLIKYAETWEGRELIYVVIGSQSNLAKLNDIEQQIQTLADPRKTNQAEANQLISNLPATVWLGYGVHGNEISSTDAAMMTAYHLLASQDTSMTQNIMDNALVFIDPLQNPDGRTRFTSRYYATVGMDPSANRYSAEHNEPWPQGRTNHYLFDMNRDWLAMTQPETQGRIATLNRYLPLVVIDLHEMGGDSSYYFAPAAEPFNPLITQNQKDNMVLIGRNHAKHFDTMGYDYFTREIYDAFYPGYGDSWPIFYGASASTYEVGSARGELFKKKNGDLYTYADSVQKHFVASVSTIEAAANNRVKLLTDFYDFQVSAINLGENKKQRHYVIPQQPDRSGAHKLAQLLVAHGIEVSQTTQTIKTCGTQLAEGSFVIDTAQPKSRMVEAFLQSQIDMNNSFIAEQEKRRSRNLRDQIYDLTAWSLPLMHNLEVIACNLNKSIKTVPLDQSMTLTGQVSNPEASVAYLVPWGDLSAVQFLTSALQAGIIVKSADLAFTVNNNQEYPAGTLIIALKNNHDRVAQLVQEIASKTGANVHGLDSSWIIKGPNFGSNNVVEIPAINIAMAWDEPTNSLSAGNSRFVIERQLGYPVTAIRSQHLNGAVLTEFDVLILPSGNYAKTINKKGLVYLTDWVKQGGVLITLGSATDYAINTDVKLLSIKSEKAYSKIEAKPEKPVVEKEKKSSKTKGQVFTKLTDLNQAIQATDENPDSVSGILARISVDQDHWLTAGVKPEVIGMVTGSQIYNPIKLDKGKNVAWFKGPDELLASGYLWEENRKQLAFKPFLIHESKGQGMVIAYTQEPTMRAFLDGLQVMLANTLFRSTAHSGKLR